MLFPAVLLLTVADKLRGSWQYLTLLLLLYGPILLATVLLHELAHCLAARALGSRAHGILLWPLGGMAFVGHSTGPKGEAAGERVWPGGSGQGARVV